MEKVRRSGADTARGPRIALRSMCGKGGGPGPRDDVREGGEPSGRTVISSTDSLLAGAGGGGPGRRVLWGCPLEADASRRAGQILRVSRGSGRRGGGRKRQAGLGGPGQPSAPASARFQSRRHDPALRTGSRLRSPADRAPSSLLPLSARLVVAKGRARRLFRPSQGCTITPAAGPSREPRRPGDPALPRAGERGQARPRTPRLSRTK